MKPVGTIIATVIVFTGTLLLIDNIHHAPPADCTSALAAQEQQAQANMNDSTPIPDGASWPTESTDIGRDTLYDPSNPATLNALYWTIQYEDVIPQEIGIAAMTCPAGGKPLEGG